jgi:hypothetical protein
MNANEGLIRIAKVIRGIGIFIALIFVVFAFKEPNNFLLILSIGLIPLVIGFAIAWVIDGFANK